MPVLIGCIAGAIAFLLVFLQACLRETRRRGPRYALQLQMPDDGDSEPYRIASAGGRR